MYRIKSPLEEYERVVKEDLLVKIEWLFARRDSNASVAPELNHTVDSATRVGESASFDCVSISIVLAVLRVSPIFTGSPLCRARASQCEGVLAWERACRDFQPRLPAALFIDE